MPYCELRYDIVVHETMSHELHSNLNYSSRNSQLCLIFEGVVGATKQSLRKSVV